MRWPATFLRAIPRARRSRRPSTRTRCGLMKRLYGIDMEKNQHPKLLEALPPVDVFITMGCGVSCPSLPCQRREDWGLDDPTGQPDEEFSKVIRAIEAHVLALRKELAPR